MGVLSVLRSPGFWIGTATLGLTYYVVRWMRLPRNLPPGPVGLPVIGAAYRLSWGAEDRMYKDFVRLGKQYGDVFSLYLGNTLTVVVNNCDIIKETFGRTEVCAGRTREFGVGKLWPIKDELFNSPCTARQATEKKFALQAMRTQGLARIEKLVATESEVIHKYFQENNTLPIDTMMLFLKATVNTTFSTVFNTRYVDGDPERDTILELTSGMFEGIGNIILLSYWFPPAVVKLLYPCKMKHLANLTQRYEYLITTKIEEHQRTFDPNEPRDIVDYYLQQGKMEQYLMDYGDMKVLTHTITMLTIDGINTVTFCLNSLLIYVAAYPDVQARIHNEIDDVVGKGRLSILADRPKMPFTIATIWECFRVSLPVMSIGHVTTCDTTIKGYNVPKSTQVIANFYAAHVDPNVFLEPERFMPERFVGKDGELIGVNNLFPFGVGRRKCVGEQTSLAQLFLFLTNMLQKFRFSISGGTSDELRAQLQKQTFIDPTMYKIIPHQL